MVSIFDFDDFRKFIARSFKSKERKGYGQSTKLAHHLGVHSTFVSQVLKGRKSFSDEQALEVGKFLNLTTLDMNYFLLLVQFDKAGTKNLKNHLAAQLAELKRTSEQIVNRVQRETKLSEEMRATFYSDWVYSAIRLSTLIPGHGDIESISKRLFLSTEKTKNVIDFLLRAGLLKIEKEKLSIGPLSTHLEAASPWIKAHHSNWRQQALNSVSQGQETSLHYSSPMTLSKKDVQKIRELLIESIKQVDRIVGPSPSEELMCLNIDWFKVRASN